MRILFTIAHFYNPQGDRKHASLDRDPRPRLIGLNMAMTALRGLYSQAQCMIDIGQCITTPVNTIQSCEVDIIVCTTQNYHLLANLPISPPFYTHHATQAEPLLLGFECQAVLRDHLGKYDYYCYLEDDLILHDPWFFTKLNWFTQHAGNTCLLQPNRYEISNNGPVVKAYIDGNLLPHLTAKFQNIQERPQFSGRVMEQNIKFQRTLNPHSGCYFLNAEQLEYWTKQPHFLDRDCSFIGPLESAATLGMMKTFKIYKPSPANSNFLEIQHFGANFLSLIGKQVTYIPPEKAATSSNS